VLSPENPGKAI
jgi:hypothetical protein